MLVVVAPAGRLGRGEEGRREKGGGRARPLGIKMGMVDAVGEAELALVVSLARLSEEGGRGEEGNFVVSHPTRLPSVLRANVWCQPLHIILKLPSRTSFCGSLHSSVPFKPRAPESF